MVRYILAVNYEKCTGCHLCELACSLVHEKVFTTTLSRITIITGPEKPVSIPVFCLQCKDAPCARVCPVNAIRYDEKIGAYLIDYNKCIGCKECVYACPFGAITLNKDGMPIKCDLCGGDPECVKVCPHDAIIYGPENIVLRKLKESKVASTVYDVYSRITLEPRSDKTSEAEEAVKTIYKIWEERKKLNI
ncbi:4Fe-4S dicluster domain-containing protein [Desulfurococcaceae archaeon MEX13E-LK6-19]|nr:4Fe-4S dicluster domain-containing protein [Desulfurococcaceae archaeon MEX13E-LK6-19]